MAFRPPDDLAPLLQALPRGLYSHTARVVGEIDRIAPTDADYERLLRAAWAHDVARAVGAMRSI
ncbi:MAG: hypothetical protein GEU28_13645, partial [Dehalococcoidia bacterium]|nr:hypothetical protein [Dehalococcoidia bacterium]